MRVSEAFGSKKLRVPTVFARIRDCSGGPAAEHCLAVSAICRLPLCAGMRGVQGPLQFLPDRSIIRVQSIALRAEQEMSL